MNCCSHCQSADKLFDRRMADADLRDYREHGAQGTTRQMLDVLRAKGVGGMTLLDIGGGVGVIQHELRAAGATSITGVDASRAYLATAREEAARRGYAAEAQYLYGDFVALADEIEPADIVTLDRVVCCYPHMEALVGAAAGRARRFLGLVYPRDGWWVKLGIGGINAFSRLRRDAFRAYAFPTAAVEGAVAASGLRRISHQQGAIWQVAVFAR